MTRVVSGSQAHSLMLQGADGCLTDPRRRECKIMAELLGWRRFRRGPVAATQRRVTIVPNLQHHKAMFSGLHRRVQSAAGPAFVTDKTRSNASVYVSSGKSR